jgi:hypothetical protein
VPWFPRAECVMSRCRGDARSRPPHGMGPVGTPRGGWPRRGAKPGENSDTRPQQERTAAARACGFVSVNRQRCAPGRPGGAPRAHSSQRLHARVSAAARHARRLESWQPCARGRANVRIGGERKNAQGRPVASTGHVGTRRELHGAPRCPRRCFVSLVQLARSADLVRLESQGGGRARRSHARGRAPLLRP